MPIAVVAAVVGVGAAIGSTVMQMNAAKQQKKAARQQFEAQQEQNRIEQARANVNANRERLAQVREARIRRASIISSAGNAGLVQVGTSGVSGATSSVQSQLGQNLGTLGQMQSFGAQLAAANQRQMSAKQSEIEAGAKGQAWQSIFGSVGQVASVGMDFAGGMKEAGYEEGGGSYSIFKGK